MATKKKTVKKSAPSRARKGAASDVPTLFRINVEVGNIDEAADFYSTLLGIVG